MTLSSILLLIILLVCIISFVLWTAYVEKNAKNKYAAEQPITKEIADIPESHEIPEDLVRALREDVIAEKLLAVTLAKHNYQKLKHEYIKSQVGLYSKIAKKDFLTDALDRTKMFLDASKSDSESPRVEEIDSEEESDFIAAKDESPADSSIENQRTDMSDMSDMSIVTGSGSTPLRKTLSEHARENSTDKHTESPNQSRKKENTKQKNRPASNERKNLPASNEKRGVVEGTSEFMSPNIETLDEDDV